MMSHGVNSFMADGERSGPRGRIASTSPRAQKTIQSGHSSAARYGPGSVRSNAQGLPVGFHGVVWRGRGAAREPHRADTARAQTRQCEPLGRSPDPADAFQRGAVPRSVAHVGSIPAMGTPKKPNTTPNPAPRLRVRPLPHLSLDSTGRARGKLPA